MKFMKKITGFFLGKVLINKKKLKLLKKWEKQKDYAIPAELMECHCKECKKDGSK